MTVEKPIDTDDEDDPELSPEANELKRRLIYLEKQLNSYPKCELSALEMLAGIFEMFDAILWFWSPQKLDYRENKWIKNAKKPVKKHLNLKQIPDLSNNAKILIQKLKSQIADHNNAEQAHAAVISFKLGRILDQIDTQRLEADASAKSRTQQHEQRAQNAPRSAAKRTWWKSLVPQQVEIILRQYPNIKTATVIAMEILPIINESKGKRRPVSINRLTREVSSIMKKEQIKT
jgi:hypothetical protein